ncbi:hypothetical protein BFJ63_vAg15747 [Fusarium oxysporum f. sp. narcissi]|uniref:Protein kinase domain-containing protein n=1 Tax=Fusarium oxysporum f. sp. narcissi TaxID=451672 RepID=A0A4V1RYE8_FUSOX|nr:hypothetical protein BFJ63_vAg15747 [Fusarium oxysporum f. sp. narcissi]
MPAESEVTWTGILTTLLELSLTPTPSEKSPITIGEWIVSAGTVGKGASGMVSSALNVQGKRFALKILQDGKDKERARKLQTKLETLAALSQKNNENRMLRLIEVIADDERSANRIVDVWFVQEPAAQDMLFRCLSRGCLNKGMRDEISSNVQRMSLPTRISIIIAVLAGILGATDFLNRNGWIQGNLKPVNIGIRSWTPEYKSLVLFDLDEAEESPLLGIHHHARPGTDGTIGWLASEREMTGYNELADIWSIGVMAIEMIRGRHPWRPSSESSQLQKQLLDMYGETFKALIKLDNQGMALNSVVRDSGANFLTSLRNAVRGTVLIYAFLVSALCCRNWSGIVV